MYMLGRQAILWLSLCFSSSSALSTSNPPATLTTQVSSTEPPQIGPSSFHPQTRPLTPDLQAAWETNTHPVETQDELGNGVYLTSDWRKAWYTYADDDDNLIDPDTGYASYVVDDIEGELPNDLSGTLYRNGPGKFGVNDQRVAHILDADGLICKIEIPPASSNEKREVMFTSKFVKTKGFQQELEANQFVQRGTFGTGPLGDERGKGLNEDPTEPSLLTKIAKRAFRTDIKNTANTQVVAFGGKLLALFEAGLPYRLDPVTLETVGEDDMDGSLPEGKLPTKMTNVPEEFLPDFVGGAAHTAHPKRCPRTGNLVGWHWSQVMNEKSLEVTVTEWSPNSFEKIASHTVMLPACELAPHDMVLTENYVFLLANAISMNQVDFLSGVKGPAASLSMDGRANVRGYIFPRPTSSLLDKRKFTKPIEIEVPACFSIHFSHGYEDAKTGNLVTIFSGWPPSDSKDFLGAWGGFCPLYNQIPPTFLWRLEIDVESGETVDLSIAPGSQNVCAEHIVVHPNFITKPAQNVYAIVSNLVGDSTAPGGFTRHRVEDGSSAPLQPGERNTEIDAYFYGTRYFCGEAIVAPKVGGNMEDENDAYLLGMVHDMANDKAGVSIFDLQQPLKEGPICNLWLKSPLPRGLHGCFDPESNLQTSYFC